MAFSVDEKNVVEIGRTLLHPLQGNVVKIQKALCVVSPNQDV